MKTICVLFGGRSSEYDVSLSSAYAVLSNIDRSSYDLLCIGITREGRWYRFDGDPEAIRSGHWCDHPETLPAVSLDLTNGAIRCTSPDGAVTETVCNAVFPVLHGKYGEDGTVQGLFAVAGIPVVGCGCTSSGVCMDKAFTKSIVANDTGIRQAKAVIARTEDALAMDALREKCEKALGYPMFVKPSAAGSSVGVSKVKTADQFGDAVLKALAEDSKVLIEEAIVGREIEVAVFEDHGEIFAAEAAEIDMGSSEFYDYETKYISDVSGYYLPARITPEQMAEVQAHAKTIFRALDCKVFSRVDFFITDTGFVFNEINTIPGFTPISMYPKMMIHSGMTYAQLIDRMLAAAFA
ncbi:MAG: D-alanine--D-alanine ligase [Clostridia bacterium]|nr:D-alanine--D-alanine ligase [Clostridia bacterium]